ncbi:cAMP-regulated D2 protein [Thecamonas trahens ATCC 50062]|uniref:Carboxylic ester hydrolase n=1 Tax=Thecamonas trahens ATCC 50062 TaxID=461836 RepID=A0A0L0DQZ1_THETB|nr:cAMP-regulated D2 protein [Thecamonas trahens ATCC 50062]KNC54724.1 cAMP-regulated D2 protein [Thecamonas trahens ATCC 50062]|eukprot:XP_013761624.1 cAMP-regulated D2 protein [Thecamonas trahens ATCC 50062]
MKIFTRWTRPQSLGVVATFLALAAVAFAASAVGETVTIDTPAGPITGIRDINVNQFLGVPYAEPPVGDLRWAPPVPKAVGAINATAFQPGCPQKCELPPGTCPEVMAEDCLYLDLFVPFWAKPTSKLAVMVFLPGGRFEQGGIPTSLYSGNFFVNDTQVILVNAAYRLGALGWLVTDGGIEGNFGFMDQVLVLEWVQKNIEAFGGDPENVMLFGQSAGGTSTTVHLTAANAGDSNLFAKVVIESNPFSLLMKPTKMAQKTGKNFAKAGGCESTDTACLRGLPVAKVMEAQIAAQQKIDYLKFLTAFYPWTPTVDGKLFTKQPIEAILAGEFKKVPAMLGSVYNEGLLFIYQAWNHTLPAWEYDALIVDVFNTRAPAILKEYPALKGGVDNRDNIAHMVTQFIFTCPARATARAFAKAGMPTYLYQFDHVIGHDIWGPEFPYCVDKVCHGEELPFVFSSGSEFFTQPELELSTQMATSWATFAKTSDPNAADTPLKWPQYDPNTKLNMHFATPSSIQSDLWAAECDKWDEWGYIYDLGH